MHIMLKNIAKGTSRHPQSPNHHSINNKMTIQMINIMNSQKVIKNFLIQQMRKQHLTQRMILSFYISTIPQSRRQMSTCSPYYQGVQPSKYRAIHAHFSKNSKYGHLISDNAADPGSLTPKFCHIISTSTYRRKLSVVVILL